MKKIITTITLLLASVLITPAILADSPLGGLGSLLQGLGQKGATSGNDTETTTTTTPSSGGLGDLLSGVAGALGLGNNAPTVEKLAGTWSYTAPAVTFKSDNFLLKAGGAAAATTIENKLEPYYKTAGLTSLVVTIQTDSTFTFKAKRMTLSGTISRDEKAGTYIFKFKALKSINVGSMEAYIALNGSNAMDLTFDVSRLMTIIQKVGAISGNSTIKGVSSLLNQYDGLTAGFSLKRTAAASTSTSTTKSRK